MLTQDHLKSILRYDPETGVWIWLRVCGGIKTGSAAGWLHYTRYRYIQINGRAYGAHQLAYLYMTGEWPKHQIDHINRKKDDNKWINLREATKNQNQWNSRKPKNNTSGYKGVTFIKGIKKNKWYARIMVNSRTIDLGRFTTKEEAALAYNKAARKYHKEFAGLNRIPEYVERSQ